ncbi:MAG: EamA family transporter [Muribaculaceae bacterium]|nr:EamA family transporter [Muribaculaceae bacterium]
MIRLIGLMLVQCLMLALGQLTLKEALQRMPAFEWSRSFWLSLMSNWMFPVCGLFFAGASLLWMYVLKLYPLNKAYPLASISYVIAMICAVIFMHEEVPLTRWIGVALIMAGCFIVAR